MLTVQRFSLYNFASIPALIKRCFTVRSAPKVSKLKYSPVMWRLMSASHFLQSTLDGAVTVDIEVQPGAKRQGLLGVNEWRGCVSVAVRAQAQKGKANNAVLHVLSTALDVPKNQLKIISGLTSRMKRIRIDSMQVAECAERFRVSLGEEE
jgi:uncharacterized protein (TIGR00251 family)